MVSILILLDYLLLYVRVKLLRTNIDHCLNPYFIGLSTLIPLPILCISVSGGLNPYFIGLSTLISRRRRRRGG